MQLSKGCTKIKRKGDDDMIKYVPGASRELLLMGCSSAEGLDFSCPPPERGRSMGPLRKFGGLQGKELGCNFTMYLKSTRKVKAACGQIKDRFIVVPEGGLPGSKAPPAGARQDEQKKQATYKDCLNGNKRRKK
jgi:hypothetical protein